MKTLSLLVLLAWAGFAHAGGILVDHQGNLVPQHEQEAYIENRDGLQTTYIGISSEPTRGPSVFIVPVPGKPADVNAAVVDIYPFVPIARPAVENARIRLKNMRVLALALDTGQLCITIGARAQSELKTPGWHIMNDTEVHHLAMPAAGIVELIGADSRDALSEYFARRGLPLRSGVTLALSPYLGKDFTLVCVYHDSGEEAVGARGVRIDFPNEGVFYPLELERWQEEPAVGAIVIRGFWLPGSAMTGTPAYLRVVPYSKTEDPDELPIDAPITRLLYEGPPADWGVDLVFERGIPGSIECARTLERQGPWIFLLVPGVVGMLLSIWLPVVMIPRGQRQWIDYIYALQIGLALAVTVYISAAIFYLWCRVRQLGEELPESRPQRLGRFLALLTLLITVTVAFDLPIKRGLDALAALLLIGSSVLLPVATLAGVYTEARAKTYWLVLLATCHLLVISVGTLLLSRWMWPFA